MNIHEIDWRVEPLHDVIVGIEAGLTAIRQRLEEQDGDGVIALEHAEPLLGLGFVAAQTYVLGTWTDLNRIRVCKAPVSKTDCYATDSITVQADITRVHVINTTANYFKHHDEWSEWPRNDSTNPCRCWHHQGYRVSLYPCYRTSLWPSMEIDRVTSNSEGVGESTQFAPYDEFHRRESSNQPLQPTPSRLVSSLLYD